jgi:hypothetical protein
VSLLRKQEAPVPKPIEVCNWFATLLFQTLVQKTNKRGGDTNQLKINKLLAVRAVISELVSVSAFSLFCGNIQGNLSNSDGGRRLTSAFAMEIQSLASRIP